MELKLFGKSIFEFNKQKGSYYYTQSNESLKKSLFLPDFYTLRSHQAGAEFMVMETPAGDAVAVPIKKPKKSIEITPKGVFHLKMLNEKSFKLNVNKDYVEKQIKQFKDKLDLIKVSEFDMTNGITEISSILIRLENRKKYPQFREFFERYPYTTTSKIEKIVKKFDYLKLGKVESFLADMPAEAVAEMKGYTENTKKLCDKKPIFYIVARKEDFEKRQKRRDPILIAQSPFGHFWQILGVWDKEMLLLEKL